MINEFVLAFVFYLVFSLFGIIGIAFLLRIPSNNLIKLVFAKPIGLLIFAFPLWFLASLKIVPFNNQVLLYVLFVLALVLSIFSIFLFLKQPEKLELRRKLFNKKFLLWFIAIEVISLILYFSYLYIRGFNGQLEGTEKFMDLLLYMSAGKTQHFPFEDPWQAGLSVNYYYYGFYLFALVNRISAVPYALGYNFTLGIIFISCALLSFATVFKITKSYLFALLGAGFVTVAGNIHYAQCVYENLKSSDLLTQCYYPKATRIYDPAYTINEMPSYSFVLGDLHPHVMGIPFLISNLFLLYIIFKTNKLNPVLIFLLSLSLATSFMVNTWDFIVLGFLYAIIFFYKFAKKYKESLHEHIQGSQFARLISLAKHNRRFIYTSLLFAFSPVIYFLPFILHFQSPVEGIGFAPEFVRIQAAGQDFQYPSGLWFLFGLWGGYFVLTLLSLAALLLHKEKFKTYAFALFTSLTALFFIIFTELFYFKDLFHIANPPYFRANTVFKLGYLAWILWSISTPVFLSYMWKSLQSLKSIGLGIVADFIVVIAMQFYAAIVFIYPYFAIVQAYNPTIPASDRWTLDGSAHIKAKEPEDYAAIRWINENIKDRKVIAEAVGGSYTYSARISANTGMINPINWPSHEWTWRFHYPDTISSWKDAVGQNINTGYNEIDVVVQDVKKVYESTDITETRSLLTKYKISYVFIGSLERTTYTEIQEEKFNDLGTVVFQEGNSKLIKIN